MGRSAAGERNFQTRFPDQVNTGYMINQDSIAIVMLNSNFSKMTKENIRIQDVWYGKIMKEMDSNDSIKAIIVSCHHSPYSDSKLVGSSRLVQEKFALPYIQSIKARLFISGHAHIFQHFIINGKNFLVIGGGGGLYHPIKSNRSGHIDMAPDYKPRYHYIAVSVYNNFLELISHKLKDDFTGTEEGLKFIIPL